MAQGEPQVDQVIGGYKIIRELGRGAMGIVYKADQMTMGRFVALKILADKLAADPAFVRRFKREAKAAARLNHPNIITVYDQGEAAGFHYIACEYISGKTLRTYLRENGQLRVETALEITFQAAKALEAAHAEDIVHRDIKPENIMLDGAGHVKVMDFGLAKVLSSGTKLSRDSQILGTPAYMSPEQCASTAEVDARSDIYSLGVVLFEMLAGRVPFDADSLPALVDKIRNDPLPDLRELNSAVPQAVCDIAAKMTAKRPSNRFQQASEITAEITAWTRGYIGAKRRAEESTVINRDAARRPRPSRSRPVKVLAGAMFAAALVGSLLFFSPLGQDVSEWIGQRPAAPVAVQPPVEADPGPPAPSDISSDAVETAGPDGGGPVAPDTGAVSVEEASAARSRAMQARAQAAAAGAEEHAGDLYAGAEELLKDGDAHDRLRQFDDAVAKYDAAETRYKAAEAEGQRVAGEIAALAAARRLMENRKGEADRLDAKTWTKTRYGQAVEAEESGDALRDTDRLASTKHYTEAERLYGLALTETRQQGEAIVAAARRDAQSARDRADTPDVKRYAAAEWDEANRTFTTAGGAGGDFERARSGYTASARAFAEAARLAGERKTAARSGRDSARDQALSARNGIGETERARAAEAVRSGETAWQAAESAGEDYALAKEEYDKARRFFLDALERAKAPPPPNVGEVRTFAGIEMIWIPPGTFQMGSTASEKDRDDDEARHPVTLTEGFWLGKYEVTKAQWKQVMGTEPWKGMDYVLDDPLSPAVYVSWNDAVAFCDKLTGRGEGLFRLPTEAEWEYACRAGTPTRFSHGDDLDYGQLGVYAWYTGNAWAKGERYAHVVGRKKPNPWGLYDMHGNVWEWCSDWYGEYPAGTMTDPKGVGSGSARVLRGGSFYGSPGDCRSAVRGGNDPVVTWYVNGFRVVRVPPSL